MSGIKTHYSCLELAELKLPGLPRSARRMRDRAARENWEFIVKESAGRNGNTRFYCPPAYIRKLIDACGETQVYTKQSEITLQLTVSLSEAEHILGWLRCNRNE